MKLCGFVLALTCCLGSILCGYDHDGSIKRAMSVINSANPDTCKPGTALTVDLDINYSQLADYAQVAVDTANALSGIIASNKGLLHIKDTTYYDMVIANLQHPGSLIVSSAIGLDEWVHPKHKWFVPYAQRPDKKGVAAFDLSLSYNYLTPYTEWFSVLRSRKSWADVTIERAEIEFKFYKNYTRSYWRKAPIAAVKDGHWTGPYFDCKGGNIWMITFSAPILALQNNYDYGYPSYPVFMGVAKVDIRLDDVDFNQCDQQLTDSANPTLLTFLGTHLCQPTTKCVHIEGQGFVLGSYKCVCENGYDFPDSYGENNYYSGKDILDYAIKNHGQGLDGKFQCVKSKGNEYEG